MKKITKIKYFILWLVVWISLLSIWVYASVTWDWTIWKLFERLWTSGHYYYRLVWDNIKDDTVDSTEIENNSLTADDLAANSVWSSELANNAVDTNAIQNWAVTEDKIKQNTLDDSEIQDNSLTASSLAANSVWNSELDNSAIFDMKWLHVNWNAKVNNWELRIWQSTSSSARNKNMIKIWDWNYVKIWEWERDNRLSLYAAKGVNITWGWLYVNGSRLNLRTYTVRWNEKCGAWFITSHASCPSWYKNTWCSGYFNYVCRWSRQCDYVGSWPSCYSKAYWRDNNYCVRAIAYCAKIN